MSAFDRPTVADLDLKPHVETRFIWYQTLWALIAYHANNFDEDRAQRDEERAKAREYGVVLLETATQTLSALVGANGIWMNRPVVLGPRSRKLTAFLYETIQPTAVVLIAALSQGGEDDPKPRLPYRRSRGRFRELLAAASHDSPDGATAARTLLSEFVIGREWSPRTHYNIACHLATKSAAEQHIVDLVRRRPFLGLGPLRPRPTLQHVQSRRAAAPALAQLRRAFDPKRSSQSELYLLAEWAWTDPSLSSIRANPEFSALTAPYRGAREVEAIVEQAPRPEAFA